jgi:hypothetical protein
LLVASHLAVALVNWLSTKGGMLRLRPDKPMHEADSLETLRALLAGFTGSSIN